MPISLLDVSNTSLVTFQTWIERTNALIANVNIHETSKLDSSAYTASDVLTKIKTVDGAGSGLDADTIDGVEEAALAKLSGAAFTGEISTTTLLKLTHTGSANTAGIFMDSVNAPDGMPFKRITWNDGFGNFVIRTGAYVGAGVEKYAVAGHGAALIRMNHETVQGAIYLDVAPIGTNAGDAVTYKTLSLLGDGTITWNGSKVWTAGNDGAGTGMDADLLDGQQGSYYQNADNLTAGILPADRFNDTSHGSRGGGSLHVSANSTIAGFMSTSDKTKLDGIETGATADQTASEILTAIKTVDGSGSGLDADLLDGVEASAFPQKTLAETISGNWVFSAYPTISAGAPQLLFAETDQTLPAGRWRLILENNLLYLQRSTAVDGSFSPASNVFYVNTGDVVTFASTPKVGTSTVWTAGNDGAGSGLDADLLDGINSTAFAQKAVAETISGVWTFTTSPAIEAASPLLLFRETDQTLPAGKWRLLLADDLFRLQRNTAAAGDFSTAVNSFYMGSNDTAIFAGAITTSGTITNDRTGDATTAAIELRRDAGSVGTIYFRTGASPRWDIRVDAGAESGSNAGSNFVLYRYTDAGGANSVFNITRSTGVLNFATTPIVAGATIWHAGNDGSGSGLDADLLDGLNSTAFAQKSAAETITGAWAFSANPTITSGALVISSSTQAQLQLRELDQTLPAGYWRAVVNGDTLYFQHNTAAAGDFSTAASPLTFSADNLATFNTDVGISSTAPILKFIETDQTAPAGRWRILVDGDVWYLQHNTAAAGDFSTTVNALYFNASNVPTFAVRPLVGISDVQIASDKGIANGIASLDASALIPDTQIPTLAISKTSGLQAALDAKAALAGANFTGTVSTTGHLSTTGGTLLVDRTGDGATATLGIRRDAGQVGIIYFQTGTSPRWDFRVAADAESGASAGSTFQMFRYDDAGASLGAIFAIPRSTGILNFTNTPTVVGATMWHAGNDGAGSGLDADTVDGVQESALAKLSGAAFTGEISTTTLLKLTHTGSANTAGIFMDSVNAPDGMPFKRITWNDGFGNFVIRTGAYVGAGVEKYAVAGHGAALIRMNHETVQGAIYLDVAPIGTNAGDAVTYKTLSLLGDGTITWNGSTVWTAGNDGAGTGMDADTVDGVQAATFQRDTRLGTEATILATSGTTTRATAGNVMTGISKNSSDIVTSFLVRPLQKNIDGTWTTVSEL